MESSYSIREGEEKDFDAIINLIKDKSKAGKISENVTIEQFKSDCFDKSLFYTYVAEDTTIVTHDKSYTIVGYILYHRTYSTWDGPTLNIDSSYVKEEHKHCSEILSMLMKAVCQESIDNKYKKIHGFVSRKDQKELDFHGTIGSTYERDWGVVDFYKEKMLDFNFTKPLENYIVREATVGDCDDILRLIRGLAVYENEPEIRVKITRKILEKDGFGEDKWFSCYVAECTENSQHSIVGFVLYFSMYSAMEGAYLKVEDLFVDEKHRSNGVGSKLLNIVTQNALQENYFKVHWCVLTWNLPAINFYQSIGSDYDKDSLGIFYFYEQNMVKFCRKSNTV